MTAKGNEISPFKMPLMRIRSVEIVFEDEMSTCTDTGILDRSIELIVSDSSDDSTKCVDDLEHLQIERESNYDSVTLNADGDLSDDNSVSLTKEDIAEDILKVNTPQISFQDVDDPSNFQSESVTLPIDITLSPNVSEFGDSGRFTAEATSSNFETVAIEDALLSNSIDAINVERTSTLVSSHEMSDIESISAETSKCTVSNIENTSILMNTFNVTEAPEVISIETRISTDVTHKGSCEISDVGVISAGTSKCMENNDEIPSIMISLYGTSQSCSVTAGTSNSATNVEKTSTASISYEVSEVCDILVETSSCTARLYEYIDSNSDDSDNSDDTATCDNAPVQFLTSIISPEDHAVCDNYDLQYDSFIDMGKF